MIDLMEENDVLPNNSNEGRSRFLAWAPCRLLSFLLIVVSGWIYRHQLIVIELLQTENRLLRERLRGKRVATTMQGLGEAIEEAGKNFRKRPPIKRKVRRPERILSEKQLQPMK